VALGISLGAMFDRSIIRSAGAFAIHGALISATLIALACALAAICSAVLRQPYTLLVLANVPGSITEMALTAKGMSLDASLVTAYHVVRIFIIIPSAEAQHLLVRDSLIEPQQTTSAGLVYALGMALRHASLLTLLRSYRRR
jgi:uncharacterized membrane protein AbrB (regulator of aidB expression)